MTAANWTDVTTGLIGCPILAAVWVISDAFMRARFPRFLPWFFRARFADPVREWVSVWRGAWFVAVLGSLQHHWLFAAAAAGSFVLALLAGWHRKNRRKVRALLGAKSRALRDALARRMPPARNPLPAPS